MPKLNKAKIIANIQQKQIKSDLPEIRSGYQVSVSEKITEGTKSRIQNFNGIIIRVRGSGLNKTFIVRRDANGVFVEKSYFYNSPLLVGIKIIKKNSVRRNYLSYLRFSKKKLI